MKGKLEPGAVCLVVGDDPGFEKNIGIMLTIVELRTSCGGRHKYWTFTDATRSVIAAIGMFSGLPVLMLKASHEIPEHMRGCDCLPGFKPQHLMPIDGADLGDSTEDEKPREEELVGLPGFGQTWP